MELRQVPTGNLAHHIVKSRFEECRGRLGYGVLQLKQSVAHTQFGCHKSQRIACSLRGQGRRATQTGIHLNDTIVFAVGVEGILHVTLTHDADMANDLDGESAQLMVLGIGERLRGSHNDRLTGMDAQRVEVFHITNGDTVVETVTHHLILYLFPSLQRLLYQHLWREGESLLSLCQQLLLIVAEA